MSLCQHRDRISEVVVQVADALARLRLRLPVFVSPNVPGIPSDNNEQVYAACERSLK